MNSKAVSILMRGQIPVQVQAAPAPQQQGNGGGVSVSPSRPSAEPVAAVAPAMPERRQDYSRYTAHKEEYPGQDAQRQAARAPQGERHVTQPIKAEPKVGRNDPCPCGSGKKYKNCHGRGLV